MGNRWHAPFQTVKKHFGVKSSYTSHINRKHSLANHAQVNNDASYCGHDSEIHDDSHMNFEIKDDGGNYVDGFFISQYDNW